MCLLFCLCQKVVCFSYLCKTSTNLSHFLEEDQDSRMNNSKKRSTDKLEDLDKVLCYNYPFWEKYVLI